MHYASCPGWDSGKLVDCTCFDTAAWRIRKEADEQFPWRIWRRTSDMTYEPLMRASSWDAAHQLVQQFIWLRHNAVRRETNA